MKTVLVILFLFSFQAFAQERLSVKFSVYGWGAYYAMSNPDEFRAGGEAELFKKAAAFCAPDEAMLVGSISFKARMVATARYEDVTEGHFSCAQGFIQGERCEDCCRDIVWGHKFCIEQCRKKDSCGF